MLLTTVLQYVIFINNLKHPNVGLISLIIKVKIVFYFLFSRIIYIFIYIAAWVYVAKEHCLDDYFIEDDQKSESKSPSYHHCSSRRGNSFVLKSALTLWTALIHIFFQVCDNCWIFGPLMKVLFKLTLSWGAHASLEDSQNQTDSWIEKHW